MTEKFSIINHVYLLWYCEKNTNKPNCARYRELFFKYFFIRTHECIRLLISRLYLSLPESLCQMLLGIFTMINERKRILLWNAEIIVMKLINSGSCTCNKSNIIPQGVKIASWEPWKKLWNTLTFFIYKNHRYIYST